MIYRLPIHSKEPVGIGPFQPDARRIVRLELFINLFEGLGVARTLVEGHTPQIDGLRGGVTSREACKELFEVCRRLLVVFLIKMHPGDPEEEKGDKFLRFHETHGPVMFLPS